MKPPFYFRVNRICCLVVCLALMAGLAAPLAPSSAPLPEGETTTATENPVYLPQVMHNWDPVSFAEPQRVDTPVYFADMTNRSTVLLNGINPCVAYGGDHLRYACNLGSGFVSQVIDDSYGVGRFASQALDKSGRAHIAYYDETNGALKYAVGSGASWTITTVDAAPAGSASSPWVAELDSTDATLSPLSPQGIVSGKHGRGTDTSIAVDANNRPHISYYDVDNRVLKYAVFTGSQWVIKFVDTSPGVGTFSSIALDAYGSPHIAYYDATNKRLKYASYDGGSWWSMVADDNDDAGQYASLAFDPQGKPAIAYYVAANKSGSQLKGDLRYAEWGGSYFVSTMIYDNEDAGKYASLAFDNQGHPAIAYYVDIPELGYLRFNRKIGDGWDDGVEVERSTSTAVGRNVSLQFDRNGKANFSYYSPAAGDYRYAVPNGSTWTAYTFANSINIGLCTSLKLDHQNRPHIAYLDETHDDLMYTYWTGSAWAKPQKLASYIDNGLDPSLALDANDDPHITYWDNRRLLYTFRSNGQWHTELAADGGQNGNVGFHSSLALTGSGKPVASYYDMANADLKYAERINGIWQTRIVDSNGEVGNFSSLALDSQERPVISYYKRIDDWNGQLRLARLIAGNWQIETVDADGNVGQYTSLKLVDDRPLISYYDKSAGALKLAEWTGSGWRIEVVDSGGVGEFSSLAIGEYQEAYVSYYDRARNDLKVAVRAAPGVWVTRAIDRAGDVGQYTSLALEDGWRMHIGYTDLTNGDLKYIMQLTR